MIVIVTFWKRHPTPDYWWILQVHPSPTYASTHVQPHSSSKFLFTTGKDHQQSLKPTNHLFSFYFSAFSIQTPPFQQSSLTTLALAVATIRFVAIFAAVLTRVLLKPDRHTLAKRACLSLLGTGRCWRAADSTQWWFVGEGRKPNRILGAFSLLGFHLDGSLQKCARLTYKILGH